MVCELDFCLVSAHDGDGAALVAAMVDEMRELYDGLDLNSADMPVAGATELGPPGGMLLVGYRDGAAICGGGVKRLPDGSCEIKRIYMVPARPVAKDWHARCCGHWRTRRGHSDTTPRRGWTPVRASPLRKVCTCLRTMRRFRTSTATRAPPSSEKRLSG
jgi:hypothetical protein